MANIAHITGALYWDYVNRKDVEDLKNKVEEHIKNNEKYFEEYELAFIAGLSSYNCGTPSLMINTSVKYYDDTLEEINRLIKELEIKGGNIVVAYEDYWVKIYLIDEYFGVKEVKCDLWNDDNKPILKNIKSIIDNED